MIWFQKYCKRCRIPGHAEDNYHVLHPDLRERFETKETADNNGDKEEVAGTNSQKEIIKRRNIEKIWNPTNRRFKLEKETDKFLSEATNEENNSSLGNHDRKELSAVEGNTFQTTNCHGIGKEVTTKNSFQALITTNEDVELGVIRD